MPFRRVKVSSSQRQSDQTSSGSIWPSRQDIAAANRHTTGRSYPPGEYLSSSNPDGRTGRLELSAAERAYARNPPQTYHGPHFERAAAQEQIWNDRGSTKVWDPYQTTRPVVPGPEYQGRSHSIEREKMKAPEYPVPYEKRPMPWPRRLQAERESYHDFSDDHGALGALGRKGRDTLVGRKHEPTEAVRESLREGRNSAQDARVMANLYENLFPTLLLSIDELTIFRGWSGRAGFVQKYPQAYESLEAIGHHAKQDKGHRSSAQGYADDVGAIDGKLRQWEQEYKYQVERSEQRPPPRGPPAGVKPRGRR
ncbi:hypothetical protein N7468_004269 [Penicillium chermesinum]|uniref:Uncharacterized protein n=1 Tax=Penicillium chermesinum TaxID=63820 RepID=A0A9W9TSE4_9EURO|nr:uncharacterized protein N7468_004269 [Penicillium chermesinum]KAJ5239650.1 hypothetical protein N7468_004269 [Penicillium chermesinum]KAJ6166538.1 hypothetical protein N7470_001985 [Penicillium chermesinum]